MNQITDALRMVVANPDYKEIRARFESLIKESGLKIVSADFTPKQMFVAKVSDNSVTSDSLKKLIKNPEFNSVGVYDGYLEIRFRYSTSTRP